METKDILLELRSRHELSQEALAEKLHVTRQAVSRWENGETVPNIDTLKVLPNFTMSRSIPCSAARDKLICQCADAAGGWNHDAASPMAASIKATANGATPMATLPMTSIDQLIDFLADHMASDTWPPEKVRAYLEELLPKH